MADYTYIILEASEIRMYYSHKTQTFESYYLEKCTTVYFSYMVVKHGKKSSIILCSTVSLNSSLSLMLRFVLSCKQAQAKQKHSLVDWQVSQAHFTSTHRPQVLDAFNERRWQSIRQWRRREQAPALTPSLYRRRTHSQNAIFSGLV